MLSSHASNEKKATDTYFLKLLSVAKRDQNIMVHESK